jgi:hypothetical protein
VPSFQDALPTFPDAEAFSLIERELGAPLESFYSSITAQPIAAASLGQVRARAHCSASPSRVDWTLWLKALVLLIWFEQARGLTSMRDHMHYLGVVAF